MFGILKTPINLDFFLFLFQFNQFKIETNLKTLKSFFCIKNCIHALYRISIIPIKNKRLHTPLCSWIKTNTMDNKSD